MPRKINNLTDSAPFLAMKLLSEDLPEKAKVAALTYARLKDKYFAPEGHPEAFMIEEDDGSVTNVTDPSFYEDEDKVAKYLEKFKAKVLAEMTARNKADLAGLGAEMPIDIVMVKASLGGILFSLWADPKITPVPKAPLAYSLLMHKRGEYAKEMREDVFELKKEVSDAVKQVTMNDNLWKDANLPAWVEKTTTDDEGNTHTSKVELFMTADGISKFQKLMSAMIQSVLPDRILRELNEEKEKLEEKQEDAAKTEQKPSDKGEQSA